jgi:hypothetical protein
MKQVDSKVRELNSISPMYVEIKGVSNRSWIERKGKKKKKKKKRVFKERTESWSRVATIEDSF